MSTRPRSIYDPCRSAGVTPKGSLRSPTPLRGSGSLLALAAAFALASCHRPGAPASPAPAPAAPPPAGAPIPWERADVDWSKPPPPGPEPAPALPPIDELRLDNGLRVLVVRRPGLPLVSLALVNPVGGSIYDPPDRGGLAALTAALLDEGAGARDSLALSEELELLGADLDTGSGANHAAVQLDTRREVLAESLALLADLAIAPHFTEPDFERVRADRLASIARRRDNARAIAPLVFEQLVYGDHPYARPAIGTSASLARIGHADVRRFFDEHWSPDHCTLVIAGDVEPVALRVELERSLGRWPRRALAVAAPGALAAPVTGTAPRLALIDRPGSPQAVVQLGHLAFDFADPRAPAAELANTLLGGSFTSALNHRLREELGYTYGASSSIWRGHGTGTWSISTSLVTAHAVDGLREILTLLERFRADAPDAAELAKARQLELQELQAHFASDASAAFALSTLATFDADLAWYRRWADAVHTAGADDLRRVTAEILARDQLDIVIVGDLAVLRPGLGELALPPAIELDADGQPTAAAPTAAAPTAAAPTAAAPTAAAPTSP